MRRLLLLTAAATLGLATPALAQPILASLKPCYVTVQTTPETYEAEPVLVSGSGFTPASTVTIRVDDEVRFTINTDSMGGFSPFETDSPFATIRERKFTVSATDESSGKAVTVGAYASPLEVRIKPRKAAPSDRVRFGGRGFTKRGPVYAHYLRKGKLRRSVRLTKATVGACGVFDVEARQFPFKPKPGVWRVQIDQNRKVSDEGPLINLTIDVRRRPVTGS